MTHGYDIIRRIREKNHLGDEAKVGVWGSTGKDAPPPKIEKDERTLVTYATTADIDLDGEVVLPEGADTTYFFKNRKIFVDHQYTMDRAVGVLRFAKITHGPDGSPQGWMTRQHLLSLPGNPLPDDILTMAKAGAAPGVSIGFIAKNFGRPDDEEKKRFPGVGSVVREWKWLELSFTAFPCNVACQTLDARPVTDDRKAGIIDGLLVKGAIRPESAYALGFPRERKAVPKRKSVVIELVA